MTNYSKVFLNHSDYTGQITRDPGKYLSFCEDVRDVHYDIISTAPAEFSVLANASWYAPGYDYNDPVKLAILRANQVSIFISGYNLEVEHTVSSSQANTVTIMDTTNNTLLVSATNFYNKIPQINEPFPDICDITITLEESGGAVVQNSKRLNIKLFNISTNISITLS